MKETKQEKRSPSAFRPGVYAGKAGARFPYRVKYARRPGRPLLVFFHGGGSVGTDNWRPLWEYRFGPYPELFPWHKRKALLKEDCTVLLPQNPAGKGYRLPDYVADVKDLCERVAADAGADLSRVYCMGVSLGGRCAWLSAYLFPDFYACAMPMMGRLDAPPAPASLKPEDLLRMKDLPIWASHSADDPVVPVGRDDETVAALRELGAPVEYTRADGKGHRYLVSYFLKTEPWAEWMFTQQKKKKRITGQDRITPPDLPFF